jgi:hypothetical protein
MDQSRRFWLARISLRQRCVLLFNPVVRASDVLWISEYRWNPRTLPISDHHARRVRCGSLPRKPSCGAGIASGPLYRECGSVAGPCVVAPPSSDQVSPPEGSDCTSPAAFSLLGSVWTVSMSSGGPSPVRACLSVKVPPGFISARRPRGIDYRCCRPCFAPGIQLFEMRRCSTCLMREVAEVHIGSS